MRQEVVPAMMATGPAYDCQLRAWLREALGAFAAETRLTGASTGRLAGPAGLAG